MKNTVRQKEKQCDEKDKERKKEKTSEKKKDWRKVKSTN